MAENKMAIEAGANFGLVPAEEIRGIELEETGAVRFQGENRALFRARGSEGSRELEQVVDRYGAHRIEEHRIEPVIMSGTIKMTVPGFKEERDSLMLGGYCFECDGVEVPFDFGGSAWNIEQSGDEISVSFETGSTPFGKDYFLDDCFEGEYEKAGLRINDITAEFLSKADRILEFTISVEIDGSEFGVEDVARMGRFEIENLSFSDGKTEHAMSRSVLSAFNELQASKSHEREKDVSKLDLPISEAKERAESRRVNRIGNGQHRGDNPIL